VCMCKLSFTDLFVNPSPVLQSNSAITKLLVADCKSAVTMKDILEAVAV